LEQLEHQEGRAVVEPSRVVDVADVRAADRRDGARLAQEALDHGLRRREVAGEELDRDAFADVDVDRFVHRGHAAATELATDLVLARQDRALRDAPRYRHPPETT